MIQSLPFMFADTCSVIDIDNFTFVNVKSTPDEIEDIKERHVSIGTPINQSLKHWLQLNFNGDIPDTDIYTWVQRAFEIVRDKYTKQNTYKKYVPNPHYKETITLQTTGRYIERSIYHPKRMVYTPHRYRQPLLWSR